MANRNMAGPKTTAIVGDVSLDFSFACNNTSDPVTTSFRGATTFVSSVAHSATGRYLVTLADTYRYSITSVPSLDDSATGGDGGYATIGAASNEGSATLPLTYVVHTRNAAGTETDFASPRRLGLKLCLKNSSVGS